MFPCFQCLFFCFLLVCTLADAAANRLWVAFWCMTARLIWWERMSWLGWTGGSGVGDIGDVHFNRLLPSRLVPSIRVTVLLWGGSVSSQLVGAFFPILSRHQALPRGATMLVGLVDFISVGVVWRQSVDFDTHNPFFTEFCILGVLEGALTSL